MAKSPWDFGATTKPQGQVKPIGAAKSAKSRARGGINRGGFQALPSHNPAYQNPSSNSNLPRTPEGPPGPSPGRLRPAPPPPATDPYGVSNPGKDEYTAKPKNLPTKLGLKHSKQVLGRADDVFTSLPKSFDLPRNAVENANQQSGYDQMLAQAPGTSTGSDALRQLGLDTAQGKYLDYNSSPLGNYFDAVQQQQRRHFDEGQVQRMDDTAIQQGAYGGARQGVERGIAETQFNEVQGEQQAMVALANYQKERDHQEQSGLILDDANQLALNPSRITSAVGDQQQQQVQRELDARLEEFNINRQLPWQDLQNYSELVRGQNPIGLGFEGQAPPVQPGDKYSGLKSLVGLGGVAGSLWGKDGPLYNSDSSKGNKWWRRDDF